MILTQPEFQTTVYGKWILAGEHAVLRGSPAIIFPVKSKSLVLQYWSSDSEARAEFSGEYGEELQFLFWSALERAIEILALNHADILGKFYLENQIPIGSGMGASAAICVAIGRWFVAQGKIPQENLLEFARQLENLFHNESSGADIAVAIANQGIYFSRRGGLHPIKYSWSPQWFLSFSGKVATTSRCVKQVKTLLANNPKLGEMLDNEMAEAVLLAEKALQTTPEEGLPQLAQAIEKGRYCFEQWGLTKGNIERHIQQLMAAGALAAKPTGSGDGGFVISLWGQKPSENLGVELIAV